MHRNLYNVFSCPAVQSNLKGLERLEILFDDPNTNGSIKSESSLNNVHEFDANTSDWSSSHWLEDSDPITDDTTEGLTIEKQHQEIFAKNLNLLASIHFKCLEILHVTKTFSIYFKKSILRLLQNNQGTLRDLSLHMNFWRSEELKTMIFPRLKCLTVTLCIFCDQDILEAFLINHSKSLEEVDIAVRY